MDSEQTRETETICGLYNSYDPLLNKHTQSIPATSNCPYWEIIQALLESRFLGRFRLPGKSLILQCGRWHSDARNTHRLLGGNRSIYGMTMQHRVVLEDFYITRATKEMSLSIKSRKLRSANWMSNVLTIP